jgi:hypothetical protein
MEKRYPIVEENKCPECGGINGGHSNRRCSLMTLEYAQQEIIDTEQKWIKINATQAKISQGVAMRLRNMIVLFQGKVAVLKAENNKLRKTKHQPPADAERGRDKLAILKKHYFNYYRPDFPSDERATEAVNSALAIKEETEAIFKAMDDYAAAPADPEALTIEDYELVLKDHRRLVRELDVIINGDNAAKQASLVDMVVQIRDLWKERQGPGWVKSKENEDDILEFHKKKFGI